MPFVFAMSLSDPTIAAALGAIIAIALVVPILQAIADRRARDRAQAAVEAERERLVRDAEAVARAHLLERRESLEAEAAKAREQVAAFEARLRERESALDARSATAESRSRALDEARETFEREKKDAASRLAALETSERSIRERLEKAAALSPDAARAELLRCLELELEDEIAARVSRARAKVDDEVAARAREALLTALERTAVATGETALVATVALPSDEWKARLVGRDGRNLRAIERALGVDLLIDDTPGVVVVSSFDPVRRETGRRALERLIADGRIHPASIDEAVLAAKRDMEDLIGAKGREATEEAGVAGLAPALVSFLGRLELATSEGQNVRRHSIEVSKLMGSLAAELGLDAHRARRAGLLHDIGKAVEGNDGDHTAAGADLARRHGEADDVIQAIAGSHKATAGSTPLAALARIADAISARRPGARKEQLERTIQRLGELEEVARAFPGVIKAFAVQAGREVVVLVDPARVSDKLAAKLARDVARDIEAKLTYPGEVQVTVLRETRSTEAAR